ncbi:MAG: HesA/MoeB/ThiF family protein [Planctomycetota bacterium]
MVAAARLPRFVGCAGAVAEILAGATVAVVGAGSVGQAALQHFARMGVGTLHIVDRGFLKNESVLTHPTPRAACGRPKAKYAGGVVRAIAPGTRVVVHQGAFEDLPLDAFLGIDLVVLATDNLVAEISVGQRCLNLGIPLLHASVLGSLLVAQLRTFTGGEQGAGPCPACLYSPVEWQQVSQESSFACDGSSAASGRSLAPTQSTSSLCSFAAELAVHRALRHLLGLGVPLADQVLEYRGYVDELTTSAVHRREDCPIEHQRWAIVPRGQAATVGAVLHRSNLEPPCSVAVDGTQFVAEAVCGSGRWQSIGRFVAAGETLGSCDHCGGPLAPSPFHTHGEVTPHQGLLDTVIPRDRAVVVRGQDGRAVLLTHRAPNTNKATKNSKNSQNHKNHKNHKMTRRQS